MSRPTTLFPGLAVMLAWGCAEPMERSPCADLDPALASSSFIVVQTPLPGERVTSPLRIAGCSRTYESNVVWELRGRDGGLLASGFTTGGGVDGPAPFEASVGFQVTDLEVGALEVHMPDASEGEGFPPPRTVFQVVLAPGT